MSKTIQQAMEHGIALENEYVAQKQMMERMDNMYFMDWSGEKPDESKMKFTPSPAPRNALLGAIRLMSSTQPIFNVPYDTNNPKAKTVSEEIEKICKSIWYHSGRFKGVPLEQEVVESILRYGMVVMSITNTTDLYDELKKRDISIAEERMMEKLTNTTPYVIETWDPKGVYPEWGRFGLNAVYRTVEMTVAQVKDQFGEKKIMDLLSNPMTTDNTIVSYADYWDLEKHMAWITGEGQDGIIVAGEPIVDAAHSLPCIPIVVQRGEGSLLDSDPERQALPFLYSVDKGKLWERLNLELSYLYTNLFYLAANPTFIYESNREGGLEFDNSVPGKVVKIRQGEKFGQLQKEVVSNDMMAGLQIANQLLEESTLYKQAMGGTGELGANAAFSAISLLQQAGRLPLASPQKRSGWAIATAYDKIFDMMRERKQKGKARDDQGGMVEFDYKNIPDGLIIECALDIDLPQDMVAQAQIATNVQNNKLASRRWIQEKILQIGQPEEMAKEIWSEATAEALYADLVEKMRKADMQAEQQGMMPPGAMPPGMGQGGMPPQGMPPQQGQGEAPGMPGAPSPMVPAVNPGEQPTPLQEGE